MIELAPITGQALLRLVRHGGGTDMGLPAPGCAEHANGVRIGWIEPGTWLLRCPLAQLPTAMAAFAHHNAALTEVSGALLGTAITGPDWRDLLMTGGVFDAEGPGFGIGRIVGTVVHHAPVLFDRVAENRIEAFVPASYAADVFEHWRRRCGRA